MIFENVWDTADTSDLVARHKALDSAISTLHAEIAELSRTIDAARLADRPTYPTARQLAGIAEAADTIRAGTEPPTHHGQRTEASPAVAVDGARPWMRVLLAAPHAIIGQGYLWDITDEEETAILDAIRAAGIEPVHHWRSDNGLSVDCRLPELVQP